MNSDRHALFYGRNFTFRKYQPVKPRDLVEEFTGQVDPEFDDNDGAAAEVKAKCRRLGTSDSL